MTLVFVFLRVAATYLDIYFFFLSKTLAHSSAFVCLFFFTV